MTVVAAVVLAAGSGTRMGEGTGLAVGTPKQFLELTPGERIVDRVIATCRTVAGWIGVVVPPGHRWDGAAVDAVIEGGSDRPASLDAGFGAVPVEAEIVVVHSASHPLASAALIGRLVDAVNDGADGVVPMLAAVDTIKRRNDDGTLTTVGRSGLGASQAPMAYRRETLALALTDGGMHVEESAAVEAVGGRVIAVDGELTNLHVTDRTSLAVVRHLATLV